MRLQSGTGRRPAAILDTNAVPPFPLVLLLLLGTLLAPAASNAQNGADTCLISARNAAKSTGIPERQMRALATDRSGKAQDGEVLPWPWTVRSRGITRWFSDRDAALAFALDLLQTGERDFDLGCFLVDIARSGDQELAPALLIDPATNAELAAQTLAGLYEELGSWDRAAIAFDRSSDEGTAPTAPRSAAALEMAAHSEKPVAYGSLIQSATDGTVNSFWQEVQ